jgi:hypothetical protein
MVLRGRWMMTKKVISTVQEYLTVVGEKKAYQIVNVELLLRRHPPEAVIAFLDQLRNEYRKKLGQLIKDNKTDSRINDLLAKNWRIKMAIITIKNSREVQDAA